MSSTNLRLASDISLANSSSSLETTQKARCIGMNNNAIPALLEGDEKHQEQNCLELCSIAAEKEKDCLKQNGRQESTPESCFFFNLYICSVGCTYALVDNKYLNTDSFIELTHYLHMFYNGPHILQHTKTEQVLPYHQEMIKTTCRLFPSQDSLVKTVYFQGWRDGSVANSKT